MLGNTAGQVSVVGGKIRADGWYGHTDGLHTVSIYLMNFTGRVCFEASIASDPTDFDWFPVEIQGQQFLSFPRNPNRPTGVTGDTGAVGMNIIGNYTWLRVRVERDLIDPTTEAKVLAGLFGQVDRVLLNN
jgi:hypothetical protein